MKEIRKNNSNNTGSDTIVFFPFDTLYQGIHPPQPNHIRVCRYAYSFVPVVKCKYSPGHEEEAGRMGKRVGCNPCIVIS